MKIGRGGTELSPDGVRSFGIGSGLLVATRPAHGGELGQGEPGRLAAIS
jgi:hypothetical protein